MFGLYNLSFLGGLSIYGKDTQDRQLEPLCLEMKPLSTGIIYFSSGHPLTVLETLQ